ncbi:MAG: preprotein translocase subunit YajC [Actinobacteria bacterium]|nr:preprotein translocase subunit YajC [Actinomycetota bacterium]
MGTDLILAAAPKTSGSNYTSLLLFVVVIGLMMFFLFRSQRRRQQSAQETQRQVVNGARIRTVHGIYGTIVDSDDQNVMVEVAPGVQIKMLRQAVGAVLPDDTPDGVVHTADDADDSDSEPESDDASATPEQHSDVSR